MGIIWQYRSGIGLPRLTSSGGAKHTLLNILSYFCTVSFHVFSFISLEDKTFASTVMMYENDFNFFPF